jgi:hypothetical protein
VAVFPKASVAVKWDGGRPERKTAGASLVTFGTPQLSVAVTGRDGVPARLVCSAAPPGHEARRRDVVHGAP